MKDVQFFRQFNVAWIFSWEYRLQNFLPTPYPLSLVRIYKIKWRPEFKTRLCGKENVEYFCRTNKKKFALHNLHMFENAKTIAPATPSKKEKKDHSSSSSTKTKTKGLSQKEKDLLAFLKMIRKCNKQSYKKYFRIIRMMTPPVQQHHHLHQNLKIFKILRVRTNCKQRRQELGSWQNAKSTK